MTETAQATQEPTSGGQEAQPETSVDTRVADLSKESASYRTQRNEAVRRAHAYETMLKAHGIDTNTVTNEALSNIPIKAGKADAPYQYKPPKIAVPRAIKPQKAGTQAEPITLEQVKKWPSAEINRRWDEVKILLKRGER